MLLWGFYILYLGSSPHPSTPDEDDSQTELLIAEEKLSPEDEGQMMPRYENYACRCEGCYSVQSNIHHSKLSDLCVNTILYLLNNL